MTLILSGTDGVSDIDGTAATPAIRGTDTNTGIFFPAADTIAFAEGGAEAMRIDSSGNVGIGTSSPGRKLQVSNTAADPFISIIGAANNEGGLLFGDNASDAVGQIRYMHNGDYMYFNTNGSERMRIDSSGNVGIGTTSPDSRLMLTTPSGTACQLNLSQTAVTNYRLSIPASTDALAFVYGASTERMRIDSSGNLLVGATAQLNSEKQYIYQSANGIGLQINCVNASQTDYAFRIRAARNTTNGTFNVIAYYNDGAGAYKFNVADSGNVTNTNGSYGTISDAKLKQDIVDANSQWDDIKNLRFRKYRLKSEVELDPNAKPFLGLVAQEAELVSPGLIEEHKDTKQEIKTREVEKTREIPAVLDDEGNEVTPAITETYTETEEYTETVDLGTTTKSIKTSILYMKAVKALQEAMTRIETLEAQNAAFEARLAALENK